MLLPTNLALKTAFFTIFFNNLRCNFVDKKAYFIGLSMLYLFDSKTNKSDFN